MGAKEAILKYVGDKNPTIKNIKVENIQLGIATYLKMNFKVNSRKLKI